MKPNTQKLWCVVTGKSLNGILGFDTDDCDVPLNFNAIGTCFGAVYFRKRDAVFAARKWGKNARVVDLVLSERGK